MANKKIIIAYHSANEQTANEIDRNLSQAAYDFEHLNCDGDELRLHQRIQDIDRPIVLLVSDNFLRCENCMYELLPTFQNLVRANRIKAIVTDGIYRDEETGIITRKPTSFDRVSNVIQYMNYWQDQYLEVRRQKRQLSSEEEVALNEQLRVIRSISSEIGEFLRFLRNRDYTTYEEFKSNNFYPFFAFTNDLNAHRNFTALPSEEDTESIPTASESLEEVITANISDSDQAIPLNEAATVVTSEAVTDFVEDSTLEAGAEEIIETSTEEAIEVPDLGNFFEEEVALDATAELPLELNIGDSLTESLENEIPTSSEEMEETPIEEAEQTEHLEELADQFEAILEEEMPALERETAAITNGEEVEEEDSLEKIEAVELEAEKKAEEVSLNPPLTSESVESIIISGNELIQEGHVYTALRRFEEGLAVYPESPALRYTFAKAILKYREDFGSTRKQLEKLLEYDSKNTDAFFLLGELDEIQEKYTAAKLNFEQVVQIDTNYPEAHYRLANLLANQFEGQEEEAVHHFALALSQNPKNADANYQYAVLQEDYLSNKEAAIEHFQQTIALQADHPYAHYDLAVIYHELGQIEAAQQAYRMAAKYNPEVKTEQNDAAFFGAAQSTESIDTTASSAEEVEASKELINKLQDDIKRLEDLVLKNQNLLQTAQNDIANLPVQEEEAATIATASATSIEQKIAENQKTVLITGATSGIGRACADIFAENGYRLILTGRRSKRLEDLKAFYQDEYASDILITSFDVRDPLSVEEMVNELPDTWQKIDILINNAGLAKGFESVHEGKLKDWDTMIDTNVKGLLYMTRAISPLMVKAQEGHIINVCSTAGKEVYPNGSVYCASKHAVDALTKGMRLDLHKYGIRVSQVAPAHVEETEFALVRFDGDAERAKIYDDFQPLRASDVADTIYFLATRPKHVNIQDVVLLGTQQASSTVIDRSGRGEEENEEIEQAENLLKEV
ncbi:MAG: SDR family NAD(P)-dependent oxidoreductase [Bacteroidota bacterium]